MKPRHKPLKEYALEIRNDWESRRKNGVHPTAVPYLRAMQTMDQIEGCYHLDSGTYIVSYFLGNATSWHGETAKRIKAELKDIIKNCNEEIAGQNKRFLYDSKAQRDSNVIPIK